MGRWGTGNFDADDCADTLDLLVKQLCDTIRTTFTRNPDNRLYDGYGDSNIVANVDILGTLYLQYRMNPLIESDEVMKWKQDYLSTHDRIMADDLHDGAVAQRRQIIEDTFNRLYVAVKVLKEFYSTDDS